MNRRAAKPSNTTPQRTRTLWRIAAIASVLFAIAGIAHASIVVEASSGFVSWVPNIYLSGYGTTNIRLRAVVRGLSGGEINTEGDTSVGLVLPPGWIATWVAGYMNGGWCGTNVSYNTTSTNYYGVVTAPCSNPAGTQTFRAGMSGQVWNGNSYSTWGSQYSPNIQY